VGPAVLDRAERRDVLAIAMPVLPPTVVLIQKLRALNEHHCDFAKLLPAARAVRERLDWDDIKKETDDNDYAAAFLVLVERLRLTDSLPTARLSGCAASRPACLWSVPNIRTCQALWPASSIPARSSRCTSRPCRPCGRPRTYPALRRRWRS